MTYNILLTGLGSPSAWGTMYSLSEYNLYGCDIHRNIALKNEVKWFFEVPPPEDEKYLYTIERFCLDNKIDLVIPQTTREIEVLAPDRLGSPIGIPVMATRQMYLKLANNKGHIIENAKSLDIPVPKTEVVHEEHLVRKAIKKVGCPCVIKPLVSSGGRGFRLIKDLRELINPPLPIVVQEYLPGSEFTVDVFRDKKNNVVVIPRRRVKVKGGISWIAQVVMNRYDIIEYSQRLAIGSGLIYCFGFQFKEKEGTPHLIECNPRVQGGMAVSTMAGFNMIDTSVKMALGLPYETNPSIQNITCVRYSGWQKV